MPSRQPLTIGLFRPRRSGWVMGLALMGLSVPALSQVDPNSGINFVQIGAVGNPAYDNGIPNSTPANHRGAVGYSYALGRMEVTSAQFVDFFNACFDRPAGDTIPFVVAPSFWGAVTTTPINSSNPNAHRWTVPPGRENWPVGGISWRTAAVYANWLCHDRGTSQASFMDGAYQVSTFGFNGNIFTDQGEHTPGSRYWIPTWDELLKATHYDPNLNGGQGGWWQYDISSNSPPVYGPPGVLVNGQPTQANAGWTSQNFPGFSPFTVPLGAFASVQSPWGLLDTAGGTTEWTESIYTISTGERSRFFDGSYWTELASDARQIDGIGVVGSEYPHIPTLEFGVRIASSIPSPSAFALGVGALCTLGKRKRRSLQCRPAADSSRPSWQ